MLKGKLQLESRYQPQLGEKRDGSKLNKKGHGQVPII
jgi:hypothetical protein